MSSNSLTKAVIDYLNLNGWKAWRQNNGGVYDEKIKNYRTPPAGSIKGVPDVIGYHKKTGVFIGVEIKWKKDKTSKEQELFLTDLGNSFGVAYVARNIDEFIAFYKLVKQHVKRIEKILTNYY